MHSLEIYGFILVISWRIIFQVTVTLYLSKLLCYIIVMILRGLITYKIYMVDYDDKEQFIYTLKIADRWRRRAINNIISKLAY